MEVDLTMIPQLWHRSTNSAATTAITTTAHITSRDINYSEDFESGRAKTGGSDILSYNLQYNAGGSSANFISVVGETPNSMVLTITKDGLILKQESKPSFQDHVTSILNR